MAAELHPRSGKLIGLSNSNRTARRNQPVQEFNHGLVLSKEPLRDRDVFTVRIDKKVNNNRPRRRRRLRAGVRAAGVREQPAGRAAGPRPSAGGGGAPAARAGSRCDHGRRGCPGTGGGANNYTGCQRFTGTEGRERHIVVCRCV